MESHEFRVGAVSPEFTRWYLREKGGNQAPDTAAGDGKSDAAAEMLLLDTYEQVQALMPDFANEDGGDGGKSADMEADAALPTVHELVLEAVCGVHRDFWDALREEGEKQAVGARRAAADALMLQLVGWLKTFTLAESSAGDTPKAAEQTSVQKIINSC